MINKSVFPSAILAIGLISCDAPGDEIVQKRKEKSADFRALISEYCATSDKIRLSIKANLIDVPCGYRQHIQLFPSGGDFDYRNPSYLEGSKPIPIGSIQFMVESSGDLEKIWDVSPPIGVVINLYSSPNREYKQTCRDYDSFKSSWCGHYIPISNTDLNARLRFNGKIFPAFSSWSGKKITPDEFPYAYYPHMKWPALYEETESFVKSLLVENSSE